MFDDVRDLRSGYNNNWLVLSNPDEGGEWVSTATIADGLTDFVLSNMQLLKWTPRHRHLTAEKQKKPSKRCTTDAKTLLVYSTVE